MSAILPTCGIRKDYLVLITICSIFFLHIVEISLYAVMYYWLVYGVSVGSLEGPIAKSFMDYFYYSIVMYTSLGIGDVFPSAHLRIISGLETLNGLILIGWSTSFTFFTMRQFWSISSNCRENPQ